MDGATSKRFPKSSKNGFALPQEKPLPARRRQIFEKPPYTIIVLTYLSYAILTLFGYFRLFLQVLGLEERLGNVERNREGYVPLYQSFESFCRRFMYGRIKDCWNKPICGHPGAYVDLIKDPVGPDYRWDTTIPNKTVRALNLGSYNYLGFGEDHGYCSGSVKQVIERSGIGVCSTRMELGTLDLHLELEKLTARFVGSEDCLVVGMGFATNATCIPTLVGRGSLIMSDEYNHSSLILGSRLSGATIRVFKHNNARDLERKLREAIVQGQPGRYRPWRNILIIVEGIYSMEGTITNLPEIIRLKKKYNAFLYLDEAHSIGSVGRHGRGVVDYYGCDPRDVDVLMGTFTKSFSAAGGFVAGSKRIIDHMRRSSHNFSYAIGMSPPVVQQIMSAMMVIMDDPEGRRRIDQLARNVRYFRRKLKQMGFIIYGSDDSPVVPLLIYLPAKVAAFVRLMEERGVATVGVGFPATSLLESRARFCLSAAHTTEMLDHVLTTVDDIGDQLHLKYSKPSTIQTEDH